ncbi:MAG: ABC transporter ATP-binding protein, partial [Spirochaetia bacterium]|nr:ABC transporter ATP-binding protein [Spirochaetia bacterium]
NMRGERTIILSSHILPEVAMTCDRIIVINGGKIIAQDEVKNLTASSSNATSILVEVEAPGEEFVAEMGKIRGIRSVKETNKISEGVYGFSIDMEEDLRKEIVSKIVKKNWGLLEMRRQVESLEDVFLKLVTKEEA